MGGGGGDGVRMMLSPAFQEEVQKGSFRNRNPSTGCIMMMLGVLLQP
jgi:hypothetical protein